jgi:hypothetical protein
VIISALVSIATLGFGHRFPVFALGIFPLQARIWWVLLSIYSSLFSMFLSGCSRHWGGFSLCENGLGCGVRSRGFFHCRIAEDLTSAYLQT